MHAVVSCTAVMFHRLRVLPVFLTMHAMLRLPGHALYHSQYNESGHSTLLRRLADDTMPQCKDTSLAENRVAGLHLRSPWRSQWSSGTRVKKPHPLSCACASGESSQTWTVHGLPVVDN